MVAEVNKVPYKGDDLKWAAQVAKNLTAQKSLNVIFSDKLQELQARPRGGGGSTTSALSFSVGPTVTGAAGSAASVTNSGTPTAPVLNFTIPAGTNGTNGTNGTSATIAVGSTTTLSPGASATVTNSGTSTAAVFQFGIPQGAAGTNGTNGSAGAAATIAAGTATSLASSAAPTVANSGSSSAATFNFGIPRGTTPQLYANVTHATVDLATLVGSSATFAVSTATDTVTGRSFQLDRPWQVGQYVNLTGATFGYGVITTVTLNSGITDPMLGTASVTISIIYAPSGFGTSSAWSMLLSGRMGDQGLTGAAGTNGSNGAAGTAGAAATIAAGTATVLAAGASPTVTNTGSSSAATFNFGIPAGPQGPAGSAITGQVEMWAGYTIPAGYLRCDGSSVSSTTYSALFGVTNSSAGSFTIATTSGSSTLTSSAAHGFIVGDSFGVTAISVANGMTVGNVYYVLSVPTTTTFTIGVSPTLLPIALSGAATMSGVLKTRWGFAVTTGTITGFTVPNFVGRAPFGATPNGVATNAAGIGAGATSHTHGLSAAAAEITVAAGSPGISMNRVTTASWTDNIESASVTGGAGTTAKTTGAQLIGSTDGGSSLPPSTYIDFIIKT